jgi:hypothetical protein
MSMVRSGHGLNGGKPGRCGAIGLCWPPPPQTTAQHQSTRGKWHESALYRAIPKGPLRRSASRQIAEVVFSLCFASRAANACIGSISPCLSTSYLRLAD